MNRKPLCARVTFMVLLGSTAMSPAFAQDAQSVETEAASEAPPATEADTDSGEIVVTAQKREENLLLLGR